MDGLGAGGRTPRRPEKIQSAHVSEKRSAGSGSLDSQTTLVTARAPRRKRGSREPWSSPSLLALLAPRKLSNNQRQSGRSTLNWTRKLLKRFLVGNLLQRERM